MLASLLLATRFDRLPRRTVPTLSFLVSAVGFGVAMLMVGAAVGPVLGGTLIKFSSYGAIGIAAILLAVCAVWCFGRLPTQPASATSAAAPA